MLVLPRAIRSVNRRMVQAALGRSRTIHGRAYSAQKKRNRVVRHKKPFDLGLPRHPEHGGRKNPCRERNQRFAEFCPKRRRRCASRQSTPRGFPRESRGIGSWQWSLVGLIGHLDREPRE